MNDKYIPPCEEFPDEDFWFEISCIWSDDEGLIHQIDWNERCVECFLQEQCIQKFMTILSDEYWMPLEEIYIEKAETIN